MGSEIARRVIDVEVRERTKAEIVADLFLLSYRGNTHTAYALALRQWFEFCQQCGVDPLETVRPHMDAWVNSMEHLRPASLAQKVSVVRNFYTYAVEGDFVRKSPVPSKDKSLHLPKVPKQSKTQGPDKDEARLLLAAARMRDRDRGKRDELILKILLHQGLRVSELCALSVKDVWKSRGHHVWLLHRKGGEEETQAIAREVVRALKAYVGARTSGPLVLSDDGGRLNPDDVVWIITCAVRTAGTRWFTPHSFRHACTTMLLDQGVPIRNIQQFLGHANSSTTERYDLGRKILDQSPAYALTGVFD